MSIVLPKTAHEVLHDFAQYIGKPRTELPWLNGKHKGYPDRVHGFYDCALAVSYFSNIEPSIISCHVWRDYAVHNKTWTTDLHSVKAGMFVIFDWETKKGLGRNNQTDHIGLVQGVDLKKGTVTYISADSTNPTPGLVTRNTISTLYITGFGYAVHYAPEPTATPVPNKVSQVQHSVPPLTPSVPISQAASPSLAEVQATK